MKIKSLKIINMNGRKCRKEISPFDNITGLTSAFYTLAIATACLGVTNKSLQSSKIIDAHLESGVRGRVREGVRV